MTALPGHLDWPFFGPEHRSLAVEARAWADANLTSRDHPEARPAVDARCRELVGAMGAAGLLGALLGWGIGEPFFKDAPEHALGDVLRVLMIIPLVLVFMCLGFSTAESIVERSLRKALHKAAIGLPLAFVLSVVFMIGGGIVYSIGKEFCAAMGIDLRNPDAYRNPALWIARGVISCRLKRCGARPTPASWQAAQVSR